MSGLIPTKYHRKYETKRQTRRKESLLRHEEQRGKKLLQTTYRKRSLAPFQPSPFYDFIIGKIQSSFTEKG